ncbi:MAG: hypothetical protein LLF83_09080 [Methanobacterium sp.]|nr:hypothetical protein [Methanobacterium sp.]
MAYWICDKCKLYFPARNEDKVNMRCKCGGKLTYHEKIPLETEAGTRVYNFSPTMQKLIMGYESALSRIILNCIDELYFPVSTKITMLILQGVQTPFIKKHRLYELETYSMLSNFSQNNLLVIIESLMNKNFLKLEHVSRYDSKPVSNLTDEGLGYVSILKLTEEGKTFKTSDENVYFGFMEELDILKA